MTPVTIYLSDTGQLPLSKSLRDRLNWKSGMKLTVNLTDKGLIVKPVSKSMKYRLENLRGFFKHKGSKISDEFLFSPVDYNESKKIK